MVECAVFAPIIAYPAIKELASLGVSLILKYSVFIILTLGGCAKIAWSVRGDWISRQVYTYMGNSKWTMSKNTGGLFFVFERVVLNPVWS